MKIGKKLFLSYFILLVITFLVTAVTFHVLSQRYLINETKQLLRNEGKIIVDLFQNIPLTYENIREKMVAQRKIELANRYINTNVIILNKDKKIIFTNLESMDRKQLLNLSQRLNNQREYVTERLPILMPNKEVKGYVLLFTKVKDVKELNQLIRGTQLLSFIAAGMVALFIGLIMEQNLTNPLKRLTLRIKELSFQDFDKELQINTGDEIEELATSFNQMARKLKQYDIMQKKFLQNASHELKTPLMAIQGNVEAIKEGVVEGNEVQESLDIIIEESQRLKKVVEEIIYLTKLENADDAFSYETVDLEEIVKGAVKTLKPLADQKGLMIHMENQWNVTGRWDKEKMKRAFINILGNSIRYGKKHIYMENRIMEDSIEIDIIDDGDGLKAGEESKIFDRFYKGDKGGTGIGLAITKAIIEGHQGKISAYNHSTYGAVFHIVLPLKKRNEDR